MNRRNHLFILVLGAILVGISCAGCAKKKGSDTGTSSDTTAKKQQADTKYFEKDVPTIERDRDIDIQKPSRARHRKPAHVERARDIDIRKRGYCNCCRSYQKGVVYWEFTCVRSFGSFRAGDKIRYGLCHMCREHCNFPHSSQCTLRAFLEK
jgi:hypothetical protein